MPSFDKSTVISVMRQRKRLQQAQIVDSSGLSNTTLSRLSNYHQSPYIDTFNKLMKTMELPVETFFTPYLEGVPADIMLARNELLQKLALAAYDTSACKDANDIIQQLCKMEIFQSGVNRQFVLCCQAQLGEIEGKEPDWILKLTKEGILLTYPEFDTDTFEGDALLFEEPRLIHMWALAQARSGQHSKAIALLQRIKTGLARLPQDDRDKEQQLALILLSLSQMLMYVGDYEQALTVCMEGNDVSIRRNKGKYIPDFMYQKAQLLSHLGRKDEIPDMIRPIYFGFMALRKQNCADEVIAFAKNIGIEFETYGAEHLPTQQPEPVYERGATVTGNSIGNLIFKLRTAAGISQGELCKGICSVTTLSRIENDVIQQGSVYHLEAFMQRLGRHIDYYFNTFLSYSDFMDKQMRDEVRTLRVNKRYREAEALLEKLEKKRSYKKGINLQFIKLSKADIYCDGHGYNATHLEMLMEAWRITQKGRDVHDIEMARLTNYEIILLINIAINWCENREYEKGLQLFEKLRNNITNFYVDGAEKMRTYLLVLYNYSKYLGDIGQSNINIILDIAEEGINLCIQYGNLRQLVGLVVNKAWALHEHGNKEKSVPYFAMAYYVSGLFGRTDNQKRTSEYVRERLGILLT